MKAKTRYRGITYPSRYENTKALRRWKDENCSKGWHLFDEVYSPGDHYLHCDACGLMVCIEKIVDGLINPHR